MTFETLNFLILSIRLILPLFISFGMVDFVVFCDDAGVLGERTDPNSQNKKPVYIAIFFIGILLSVLAYKYSGISPDISAVVQTTNIDLYDPHGHTGGGPRPGKD